MAGQDWLQKLRQLDAYPKTLEDFRVKTFGGATITLVSGFCMLLLFLSELYYYLSPERHAELFVDTATVDKIRINMNITFPKMPCEYLSIDAMDVSGEQQIDVAHHLLKLRLNPDGTPLDDRPEKQGLGGTIKETTKVKDVTTLNPNRCESCYGAEPTPESCCNTCEQVRDAYRKKGWAFNDPGSIVQCAREGWTQPNQKKLPEEGCKMSGYLEVNKVAGNFHFAPGKSFSQHHVHVHDLKELRDFQFDLSHSVQQLSFGQGYPGSSNALDGTSVQSPTGSFMFQYYVKVVPTTYHKADGSVLYTNQYSVTTHRKQVARGWGGSGLPGVFFMYELSPMMVKYTERQRSFAHFVTGVCSIIGGVFSVATLLDSLVYHSSRAIQKKIELGKQT